MLAWAVGLNVHAQFKPMALHKFSCVFLQKTFEESLNNNCPEKKPWCWLKTDSTWPIQVSLNDKTRLEEDRYHNIRRTYNVRQSNTNRQDLWIWMSSSMFPPRPYWRGFLQFAAQSCLSMVTSNVLHSAETPHWNKYELWWREFLIPSNFVLRLKVIN